MLEHRRLQKPKNLLHDKYMHLNTSLATNRINVAELRFLREATADTATGCRKAARQAIVTYKWLSDKIDLRQEAAALDAEDALLAARFAPAGTASSLTA